MTCVDPDNEGGRMKFKKFKDNLKNIIRDKLDQLENTYYEETLNQYGLKHATRKQVMKYVKKLKEGLGGKR